jgi:hypothetical protein
VDVRVDDLLRRARRNHGFVEALVRSKADSTRVREALKVALDPLSDDAHLGSAASIVETGRGPAFLIARWTEDVPVWLAQIADALTAAGIDGTIQPAVQGWGRVPTWEPSGGLMTIGLGAAILYRARRDDYEAAGRYAVDNWQDDPEAASIIIRACAWASDEAEEITLNTTNARSYPLRSDPGTHAAALTRYFEDTVRVGAKVLQPPGKQRDLSFRIPHDVNVSIYDAATEWPAQLDQLRHVFDWSPESIDVATIFLGWTGSWLSAVPPVSYGSQRADLYRFLPDIRGVQLVTEQHLDKVFDLTGWSVTQKAPARYVLEADDLGPWYSGTSTDPETLSKARDQFHDLLMANQPRGTFYGR